MAILKLKGEYKEMAKDVIATIRIDDDRWAKWPYGVEFDDEECNRKYGRNGFKHEQSCRDLIQKAKEDGYKIIDVKTIYY